MSCLHLEAVPNGSGKERPSPPPHDPQHAAVNPALGPLGLDAEAVEQLGDLPQRLALLVELPNPGQRLLLAPVLDKHSFRPEVPAKRLVAADPLPAAALDLHGRPGPLLDHGPLQL